MKCVNDGTSTVGLQVICTTCMCASPLLQLKNLIIISLQYVPKIENGLTLRLFDGACADEISTETSEPFQTRNMQYNK